MFVHVCVSWLGFDYRNTQTQWEINIVSTCVFIAVFPFLFYFFRALSLSFSFVSLVSDVCRWNIFLRQFLLRFVHRASFFSASSSFSHPSYLKWTEIRRRRRKKVYFSLWQYFAQRIIDTKVKRWQWQSGHIHMQSIPGAPWWTRYRLKWIA